MRKNIVALAAGACLLPVFQIGSAAAQETIRVRGTIEAVDGPAFAVETRDGKHLKIALSDKPLFVAIVKAAIADIKPGAFIGATGEPQPDGTQKAIEVHIFPESMRGTGEGHREWDLKPKSTMTNANVEQTVDSVDGRVLAVKYKGGEQKLLLTPETSVVTYAAGDRADLKPGTKIFISAAARLPGGSFETPRITYGKDGLTPPM